MRHSVNGTPTEKSMATKKSKASKKAKRTPRKRKRWSQRVTRTSNALDLEEGVFSKDDPRSIARSLKRSAERSKRRKSDAYRSAMSMLTFFINRAGKTLPKRRRAILEKAKDELRTLYGKAPRSRGRMGSSHNA
jgi:hypothetical protein